MGDAPRPPAPALSLHWSTFPFCRYRYHSRRWVLFLTQRVEHANASQDGDALMHWKLAQQVKKIR